MTLDRRHVRSLFGMATALSIATFSCSRTSSVPIAHREPVEPGAGGKASELQVVETTRLAGFEEAPTNDPEVRRMSDGSLFVVFNCMPPCFTPDLGEPPALGKYEHFDAEMQEALGVDVFWEDREFFRTRNPKADTMSKLQSFVAGYHHRQQRP